nr:unnamed protein product [Callosobruchus chinensis]
MISVKSKLHISPLCRL